MNTKLEKYLERFPINATSWSQATDEIRDLARTIRELLEDYQGIIVEPIDFRAIKTPSEWNKQGRIFIVKNFTIMNKDAKNAFNIRFAEWFK
ncbi:MAG: hypothetical protein SNH63_06775 [Rikenellaceae bacterium]